MLLQSAHFSLQDMSLLVRHISAMLQAGSSFSDALESSSSFLQSSSQRALVQRMAHEIEGGEAPHTVFKKTGAFDTFLITALEFAQQAEAMDTVLANVAEQYDQEREVRSELQSALVYPAIVFTLTLFVFGLVIFFVVPQIQPVFQALPFELPLATRILFATTTVLQSYWWVLLLFFALIVFIVSIFHRAKWFSSVLDTFLLRIPFVSDILLYAEMERFSRQWALLAEHGKSPVDAVEILLPTIGNSVVRDAFTQFSGVLKDGGSIEEALKGISDRHFPVMVQQALKTGIKSEEVAKSLLALNAYLRHIVKYKIKTLITVFEPTLLVIVSLLVGLLALSIISPLYEVTSSVGGL